MIGVFIDTAAISESFNLNQEDVNKLLDFTTKTMTSRFAEAWSNEASRSLHSARQQYISNLVVVDEGFAKGAVMLTGWLPNAIEQGKSSYDMKEGFLNGPKARVSKDGHRYNIIPFTWGTPGALQENFTGGILPQEVYDVVSKKPQDLTISGGGKASKPLKPEEIPKMFREPKTKSISENRSYTHKSSIYEGISKVKDPVTKQNSYISFRAVSDNSDPNSWIHPGFTAANLAEKALAEFNVPMETARIIDLFLKGYV